jgi:alpha-2-macroglobulin
VERTLTITATPQQDPIRARRQSQLRREGGGFRGQAGRGRPELRRGGRGALLGAARYDGDIVASFYPKREVYLDPQTSFEFYFEGEAGTKSPLLAGLAGLYHPRMAQVKPGSDLVVPKVRKAFPDTAYWNPDVRTGATGTRAWSSTSPMR